MSQDTFYKFYYDADRLSIRMHCLEPMPWIDPRTARRLQKELEKAIRLEMLARVKRKAAQ